ncbi:MAG: hypothetical protein HC819_14930 [Cyclobacteriaceae bacterium]|nr:hypothetical protein [Cyclobacteriaceae bacterium]
MKEESYKIDTTTEGSVKGYIMERKILRAFSGYKHIELITYKVFKMSDNTLKVAYDLLYDVQRAYDYINAYGYRYPNKRRINAAQK